MRKVNEAELITPVFSGDEYANNAALGIWNNIIQALSSITYLGDTSSDETKKALYSAIAQECDKRICALNPQPAPVPVTSTTMPVPMPVPVPMTASQVDVQPEVVINFESKQDSEALIRRYRELAGIPHHKNRV